MSEITRLRIDQLIIDAGTQNRAELNADAIADYVEKIDLLPPVDVMSDGKSFWLFDGFHRVAAHREFGRDTIPAVVHKGSLRDAIEQSLKANATHGVQRTPADKRHAVLIAINDPEWIGWSDHKIADLCNVSHQLVGKVRKGVTSPRTSDEPATVTYTNKHGTVSTMRVGNIGKRPAADSTAGQSTPEPSDPAKPWAEFEAAIRQVMAMLRGAGDELRDVLQYDPSTKQVLSPWAKYYSYSGSIGAVNQIVREIENGLPCEATKRTKHGYINAIQKQIMERVIPSRTASQEEAA